MKTEITIALFLAFVLFTQATRAQDSIADRPAKHAISSYTTETARVEDVLQVEDDGYRSVTYVVMWKGKRVGVEDPLSRSTHNAGDVIRFMVSRWHPADKPDPKSLRFTLLELPGPTTQAR